MVIDQEKNIGILMEVELKSEVSDVKAGIQCIYGFLETIGITKFELQKRGYVSMLWNPEFNFSEMIEL